MIVRDFGAVAQLVRASDCRSEGCAFESRRPRYSKALQVKRLQGFLFSLIASNISLATHLYQRRSRCSYHLVLGLIPLDIETKQQLRFFL